MPPSTRSSCFRCVRSRGTHDWRGASGTTGKVVIYDFDWSSIPSALPFLWKGMRVSMEITAVAVAAGIVGGTPLAMMRLSSNRHLASFALFYLTVFRAVPLVMVLLWFFLVTPELLRTLLGLG